MSYVQAPLSPFEQALADMNRNARLQGLALQVAPALGLLGEPRATQVQDDLRFVLDAQGKPFQAVAHCFCGL